MSVEFWNTYWLLGDGADEEAKRWVALDKRKEIVYSSSKAVELYETGNYLSPKLPIPLKGFMIVLISWNDVQHDGPTLGVAHWGGDGGWIMPKDGRQEPTDVPETESIQADTAETAEDILAEADFLEELRKMSEHTGEHPFREP